ncbi:hypothetical protein DCAR_0729279 [Daucus carota subsp. sativus]|uniref:AB hydrolase-1 domain-containing protein n=2 Tax=Daucus carota subsp. sativus TaxID=79200 RepID=A0AAF0XL93_DAUCS|nr:hypothetical protein DCAR_0729279 [Daucus carota subsp. sativus]
MASSKGWVEKMRRIARTIYFMVAMVASLLVMSLPLLIAIGDVLLPALLISSFTCVTCHSFLHHLRRYAFNSSLTDIPLVSLIRSLLITCVYYMCDGPALSHGPYLGTVAMSSIASVLLLSVKAYVFSVNSQIEAEASLSLSKRKLHLKKSWGMPVLFLSSVVFALGHIVVAYRTRCRARRKLMLHRVDPESILSCKIPFSVYQKVPRSPTPAAGKTLRSDSELIRRPGGLICDQGELPVQLLADVDSLFMMTQGINLHYKLSISGAPSRSLSSSTFLSRPSANVYPKSKYYLHRSFSSQFNTSSLHTPLLDRSNYPGQSEEIPILSLNEAGDYEDMSGHRPPVLVEDSSTNRQFGIVLVHGFGGGVFSWRHVMGVLARQVGCTVAAFDRPGWGLTSRPQKQDWEENQLPNPYKLETQVDLLLNFCSEMGFSSVVLVGHDDGGLLALKAAQKVISSAAPVNVEIKGVVLLNVSLSREVVPGFARIILGTSLKRNLASLVRAEIIQAVNRRAWYDATKLTTGVTNLYRAPFYVEGWVEALHEIGRLSSETVLSPKDAASLVAAVQNIPVLVIAGAEDAVVSLDSVQTMASNFVNSRLVAISGCGHLPHEECPKALLAALSPFISRLLSIRDLQN